MTALVVGFLLVLIVAMAIILAVALPHVREGAPVLTDRGEQLTRTARTRAAALAHGAADAMTDVVAGVGGRSAEHHLANHPAPARPRPAAAARPVSPVTPAVPAPPAVPAMPATPAFVLPSAPPDQPAPAPAGSTGAGAGAVPVKRPKAGKQQARGGGKARKGAARTR